MSIKTFMVYGANGFTGQLIVKEALKKGLRPVIAGRNQLFIETLSTQLSLDYKIFNLNLPSEVSSGIAEVDLVLNCAGPFSQTAEPIVKACLDAKKHYVDITTEVMALEMLRQRNVLAKQRNIMILAGVGFEVVATDCLAATLKKMLPNANKLVLANDVRGGYSKGVVKTILEALKLGGLVRENGMVKKTQLGHKTLEVEFAGVQKHTICVPGADISTAFHSTGIPNIEVFRAIPRNKIWQLKLLRYLGPLAKPDFIQKVVKKLVDRSFKNPDSFELSGNRSYVWGKVENESGESHEARISLPNSYLSTAESAIAVVTHFMKNEPEVGVHTPSELLGEHFVRTLSGVEMQVI